MRERLALAIGRQRTLNCGERFCKPQSMVERKKEREIKMAATCDWPMSGKLWFFVTDSGTEPMRFLVKGWIRDEDGRFYVARSQVAG